MTKMTKKSKKRIGMKCIKFPYGETVVNMIVYDGKLFVATSKNVYVYLICEAKAKQLNIKGELSNGKKK
jgi:hypothetical protein